MSIFFFLTSHSNIQYVYLYTFTISYTPYKKKHLHIFYDCESECASLGCQLEVPGEDVLDGRPICENLYEL